jgi:hypothetical protein
MPAFLTTMALAVLVGCSSASGPAGASLKEGEAAASPKLTSVSPDSAEVGARVVVRGSGFRDKGNALKLGDGWIRDLPSEDGTTIVLQLPDGLERCAPDAVGPCAGAYSRLKPGRYDLAVWTPAGLTETRSFTVTGGQ